LTRFGLPIDDFDRRNSWNYRLPVYLGFLAKFTHHSEMLMLEEKTELTFPTSTFFAKIKELELGPIAYKLMHPETGEGLSYLQVSRALTRYLMFLCLVYLYPNVAIAPSQEIDQVWHQHILDTSKYAQDCQMLFGRFIHHFPYFGIRNEGDRQQLNAAFAQTQALFKQHFDITLAEADTDASSEGSNDSKTPGVCVLRENTHAQRPSVEIEIQIPDFLS
jgi:hypothetical protein